MPTPPEQTLPVPCSVWWVTTDISIFGCTRLYGPSPVSLAVMSTSPDRHATLSSHDFHSISLWYDEKTPKQVENVAIIPQKFPLPVAEYSWVVLSSGHCHSQCRLSSDVLPPFATHDNLSSLLWLWVLEYYEYLTTRVHALMRLTISWKVGPVISH